MIQFSRVTFLFLWLIVTICLCKSAEFQCWYMDNDTIGDPRLEHHRDPMKFCTIQEVFNKTGVEYFHFPVETYIADGELEALKRMRGYTYEDEITISKDTLPDYANSIKKLFTEHLHSDEEIRYVTEGTGYFDVRDLDEDWIRMAAAPGDMIILPSGIYHRFTLDTKDYIKVKRFMVGEPVWLAHNRPADDMDSRKEYVKKVTVTTNSK